MKSWFTLPILLTAVSALGTSAWGETTSKSADWQLRVRSLQTDFSNHSDAFNLAAVRNFSFSKDAIRLSQKSAMEVDITRYLGGGLAVEVGYIAPQKRTLAAFGSGVGSVKTAQTTATLQYHFKSKVQGLTSYVGAGLGSVNTSQQALALLGGVPAKVGSSSAGVALQIGLDYKLSDSVYLNVDYKYLTAKSNLTQISNGATLTSVKLDPASYGVGIGVRF